MASIVNAVFVAWSVWMVWSRINQFESACGMLPHDPAALGPCNPRALAAYRMVYWFITVSYLLLEISIQINTPAFNNLPLRQRMTLLFTLAAMCFFCMTWAAVFVKDRLEPLSN